MGFGVWGFGLGASGSGQFLKLALVVVAQGSRKWKDFALTPSSARPRFKGRKETLIRDYIGIFPLMLTVRNRDCNRGYYTPS